MLVDVVLVPTVNFDEGRWLEVWMAGSWMAMVAEAVAKTSLAPEYRLSISPEYFRSATKMCLCFPLFSRRESSAPMTLNCAFSAVTLAIC